MCPVTRRSERGTPRVVALVGEGVSLFELTAAWEIFGREAPEDLGRAWYEFSLCSDAPPPIRASLPSVSLTKVRGLSALGTADTVVVPPVPSPSPEALFALRKAHERGARVLSLCTGAFVLAAAGLLDGRPATTHWANAPAFAERYPLVEVNPRVLYVDDGDVVTSAGSAACIDMCIHIVRRDFGAEIANDVARHMVMPPYRSGGQAQFVLTAVPPIVAEGSDLFSETLQWAEAHLDEALTVELLARRSAMSDRTYARRFRDATGTTPHQWILGQRLMLSQRLLETTDLSIDVVAAQCGLGTAANLRMHFQRAIRTTPTAYRRTFRAEAV